VLQRAGALDAAALHICNLIHTVWCCLLVLQNPKTALDPSHGSLVEKQAVQVADEALKQGLFRVSLHAWGLGMSLGGCRQCRLKQGWLRMGR
jgi:hypothetical protein